MRQIHPVGKNALVDLFLNEVAIWDQQLDDAVEQSVGELCELAERVRGLRECEGFVSAQRWSMHVANVGMLLVRMAICFIPSTGSLSKTSSKTNPCFQA